MKQERFSIRKTKLGAMSARIAVLGLLALPSLGQEVKADEIAVDTTPTTTEVSPTETVTAADVNQAEKGLVASEKELSQAQSNVDRLAVAEKEAQSELVSAQKEVDQAQALQEQATALTIAQAEEASAIATAKEEEASKAVAASQEQFNEQTEIVASVQERVRTQQEVVNRAQEQLIAAQSAVVKAEQDQTAGLKDQEEAAKQVQIAQAQLEQATSSEAERETQLKKAQDELIAAQGKQTEAQGIVTEKTTDLNQKTTALEQAQAEVNTAQSALASAQNSVYPQTITVSEEFKTLFRQFLAADPADRTTFEALLHQLDKQGDIEYANNPFEATVPSADNDIIYDPNNLPQDLLEELNLYFATLMNSIHAQFGDGKTTVINRNVINFAKDVAAEYKRTEETDPDSILWWNGHNMTAINAAASKHGLWDDAKTNLFENASLGLGQMELTAEGLIYFDKASRAYLFEQVYNTVVAMMFVDYGIGSDGGFEGGHARSIYNAPVAGLALSQYSYGEGESLYHLNVHHLQVKDSGNIKFSDNGWEEYREGIREAERLWEVSRAFSEQHNLKGISETIIQKLREQESYTDNGLIFSDNPNWEKYQVLQQEIEDLRAQQARLIEEWVALQGQSREVRHAALSKYAALLGEHDKRFEEEYSVTSSATIMPKAKDTASLQAALATAQANLTQAQEAHRLSQTAQTEAQAALVAATAQAEIAQERYLGLLSMTVDKASAERQLAAATTQLQTVQERVRQTQDVLNKARQTQTNKEVDLLNSQEDLRTAQEELSRETAEAERLANQLTDDKVALEQALLNLSSARRLLDGFVRATKEYEMAQNRLTEAQARVTLLNQQLVTARNNLVQAQQKHDNHLHTVDRLKSLLRQTELENQLKEGLELSQQRKDLSVERKQFLKALDKSHLTDAQKGELAIRATFAESLQDLAAVVGRFEALTASVVAPEPAVETKPAAKPVSQDVTKQASMASPSTSPAKAAAPTTVPSRKTLPATGDTRSHLFLVGAGLLTLGLVPAKRRR